MNCQEVLVVAVVLRLTNKDYDYNSPHAVVFICFHRHIVFHTWHIDVVGVIAQIFPIDSGMAEMHWN